MNSPKLHSRYRVGFVGAGNMASAMVAGLRRGGFAPQEIGVFSPSGKGSQALSQRWRIQRPSSVAELADRSEILVLAMKPNQLQLALRGVPLGTCRQIWSVMAGVSLSALKAVLQPSLQQDHPSALVPLLRLMPNLGVASGSGIVYMVQDWCEPKPATASELADWKRKATVQLPAALCPLRLLGAIQECPEEDLAWYTAVSGSGPAYFAYLAQALQESVASLPLSPRLRALAVQSAFSAAGSLGLNGASVSDGQIDPSFFQQIIDQVASKGGTTEAALMKMTETKVAAAIGEAVEGAIQRASQLEEQSIRKVSQDDSSSP